MAGKGSGDGIAFTGGFPVFSLQNKKRKRYEYRFLVYSFETDALIKTDMSQ
jgi:hypothetical protein